MLDADVAEIYGVETRNINKAMANNPDKFPVGYVGLYMLATIFKSPQAIQATLAIIETFSKIWELFRNVKTLSNIKDKTEQQNLMQKSGELIRQHL